MAVRHLEPGRADADRFFKCGKKEPLSANFIFRKIIF